MQFLKENSPMIDRGGGQCPVSSVQCSIMGGATKQEDMRCPVPLSSALPSKRTWGVQCSTKQEDKNTLYTRARELLTQRIKQGVVVN